jgi:hypothetical protein
VTQQSERDDDGGCDGCCYFYFVPWIEVDSYFCCSIPAVHKRYNSPTQRKHKVFFHCHSATLVQSNSLIIASTSCAF